MASRERKMISDDLKNSPKKSGEKNLIFSMVLQTNATYNINNHRNLCYRRHLRETQIYPSNKSLIIFLEHDNFTTLLPLIFGLL